MTACRGYYIDAYRKLLRNLSEVPCQEWGGSEIADMAMLMSGEMAGLPQIKALSGLEPMIWGNTPEQAVLDHARNDIEDMDPIWMYEKAPKRKFWDVLKIHGDRSEVRVGRFSRECIATSVVLAFDNPEQEVPVEPYKLPEGSEIRCYQDGEWSVIVRDCRGDAFWLGDVYDNSIAKILASKFDGHNFDTYYQD